MASGFIDSIGVTYLSPSRCERGGLKRFYADPPNSNWGGHPVKAPAPPDQSFF